MSGFFSDNDFGEEFDSAKCAIKLRGNDSSNPKAPALKGFIAIDKARAERILEYVTESDSPVIYMDVALWSGRDGKYLYEGNAQLKSEYRTESKDSLLSKWEAEKLKAHSMDDIPF